MRAVVTRVASAGGVEKDDTSVDVEFIASNLKGLRVFEDAEGKMNMHGGRIPRSPR